MAVAQLLDDGLQQDPPQAERSRNPTRSSQGQRRSQEDPEQARTGHRDRGRLLKASLRERFEHNVDKSNGEDACHVWTGTVKNRPPNNYGSIKHGGKRILAHRLSWEIAYGKPPDGNVLHRCDNPLCVNPRHLYIGTQSDNMRDVVERKRRVYARGSHHAQSKLSEREARQILLCKGQEERSVTAKRYGVSYALVYLIQERIRWAHLS